MARLVERGRADHLLQRLPGLRRDAQSGFLRFYPAFCAFRRSPVAGKGLEA
jgi:hypothetical protein